MAEVDLGTYALGQTLQERSSKIIRVGPEQSIKTMSAAARLAKDGDLIEIEAGEYSGVAAVAVWTQNNLTIRGVQGRPLLIADGKDAEGKGIWVIRGRNILVENVAFSGARVQRRNGAGIWFERGSLTVRRCAFTDNENGMLVGNDPATTLEIEDSEFADNGAGDGYSHNLYVGTIQRFVVQGSYFRHGRQGHLLKTRAKESLIRYNRLTDETEGRASYELEFPDGGYAQVLGNLIQQNDQTENSTILSFGTEGYKWPRNELYLSYNTIINDRPEGGVFVRTLPGSAYVRTENNIYVGKGELEIKTDADLGKVWRLEAREFVAASKYDYRLKSGSSAPSASKDTRKGSDEVLRPTSEYTYPVGVIPLAASAGLRPGAFQSVPKQ